MTHPLSLSSAVKPIITTRERQEKAFNAKNGKHLGIQTLKGEMDRSSWLKLKPLFLYSFSHLMAV